MSKTSIITLTYKGLEVLRPCVESVLSHSKDEDFEWIIRVNLPNDGTIEYLKSLNTKQLLKIVVCENDGNFSKMNNEMIEHCEGENLLFLNNDIEALCNFIKPMSDALKDSRIGSVGAQLYYPNGQVQHAGIVFDAKKAAHNLSTSFAQHNKINIDATMKDDRLFQCATGACLMVRKEDFLSVGKFNEIYHWAYEDVELGLRITHELGKYALVPKDVKLIHKESWSQAKPTNWESLRILNKNMGDFISTDYFMYNNIYFNKYEKL